MTTDQAKHEFVALVRRYGLHWTAAVPAEAYARLQEINRILTERDRREALGFRT